MMSNFQKISQSFSDLVDVLYDLTAAVSQRTDYAEIGEDMALVDKITTNLKRMAETGILENSINEGDTNVN